MTYDVHALTPRRQSARCQKADWKKEHKFGCSPLNGPLPPPAYTPEQLEEEVQRASTLLQDWLAKANENKESKTLPEGTQRIRGTSAFSSSARVLIQGSEHVLPPELVFPRECQDDATYPYRRVLASLTRLFLVRHIGHMSPAARAAFSARWQSQALHMPPSSCPLYGPKLAARPGELAPGEYAQLLQIMPVLVMDDSVDQATRDRWIALCVAQKKLYSVRADP
jgi:hypothetical protein